jgi:hypothetical protein
MLRGCSFAQMEAQSPSYTALDRRVSSLFFCWGVFNVFLGAMLVPALPPYHFPSICLLVPFISRCVRSPAAYCSCVLARSCTGFAAPQPCSHLPTVPDHPRSAAAACMPIPAERVPRM